MPHIMKIIVCVQARPNNIGTIRTKNPNKVVGVWVIVQVIIVRYIGADIIDLGHKLSAAAVLTAQYPLLQSPVFWDLQLHSGTVPRWRMRLYPRC